MIKYINSQLLYQKLTTPEYMAGLVVAFLLNVIASWFYNLISDNDKTPIINNNNTTINHAPIKAGINFNTKNAIICNDSSIVSSTQDLNLHQVDSLRQR